MAPTLASNQMKNKFILFTSLLLLSACSKSDKSDNEIIVYKQAQLVEISGVLYEHSVDICQNKRNKQKNMSPCVVIYLKNGVPIPKSINALKVKDVLFIYRLNAGEEIINLKFEGLRNDCETFKRQGSMTTGQFCLSTQEDLNNFLSPYLKN